MSTERDEEDFSQEYGSTSDEIKNDLLDFLRGSPVDSAKYHAFMDYQNENDLNEGLGDLIAKVNNEPDDLIWHIENSQIRIYEHRIAYLEHSIEQKRMSKPGYEDAYLQIWGTCEELGLVLCEEGEEKYPGDSKEKENYYIRYK